MPPEVWDLPAVSVDAPAARQRSGDRSLPRRDLLARQVLPEGFELWTPAGDAVARGPADLWEIPLPGWLKDRVWNRLQQRAVEWTVDLLVDDWLPVVEEAFVPVVGLERLEPGHHDLVVPREPQRTKERSAVFLHGFLSGPQACFAHVLANEPTVRALHRTFPGGVWFWRHRTLLRDPIFDAAALAHRLEPLEGPVTVVAHSRGGILADLLSLAGTAEPTEAAGLGPATRALQGAPRLKDLHQVVRFGCPADGSPLASPGSPLGVLISAIGWAGKQSAQALMNLGNPAVALALKHPMDRAVDFAMAVGKGLLAAGADPAKVPGMACLAAGNPVAVWLREQAPLGALAVDVPGRWRVPGLADALEAILGLVGKQQRAWDLVVPTDAMLGGRRRSLHKVLAPTSTLVHHFAYFSQPEFAQAMCLPVEVRRDGVQDPMLAAPGVPREGWTPSAPAELALRVEWGTDPTEGTATPTIAFRHQGFPPPDETRHWPALALRDAALLLDEEPGRTIAVAPARRQFLSCLGRPGAVTSGRVERVVHDALHEVRAQLAPDGVKDLRILLPHLELTDRLGTAEVVEAVVRAVERVRVAGGTPATLALAIAEEDRAHDAWRLLTALRPGAQVALVKSGAYRGVASGMASPRRVLQVRATRTDEGTVLAVRRGASVRRVRVDTRFLEGTAGELGRADAAWRSSGAIATEDREVLDEAVELEVDERSATLPWELLQADGGPISVRNGVVRVFGAHAPLAPRRLSPAGGLTALLIADPEGADPPLPGAREETLSIKGELERAGYTHVECLVGRSGRDNLDALLRQSWRVVHVASHGSAGGIFLGAGAPAVDATFALRLRAAPALVFLNCCTSSDLASGLARGFLDAGASAAVLTVRPVGDATAIAYATAFYNSALGGDPLLACARAGALAAWRRWDPTATWSAYQVWGSADARLAAPRSKVLFAPVEAAGGPRSGAEAADVLRTWHGMVRDACAAGEILVGERVVRAMDALWARRDEVGSDGEWRFRLAALRLHVAPLVPDQWKIGRDLLDDIAASCPTVQALFVRSELRIYDSLSTGVTPDPADVKVLEVLAGHWRARRLLAQLGGHLREDTTVLECALVERTSLAAMPDDPYVHQDPWRLALAKAHLAGAGPGEAPATWVGQNQPGLVGLEQARAVAFARWLRKIPTNG